MIEAENTSPVTTSFRTDLDVLRYMPDWLQPAWEFLSPYPGLLTMLLILTAYFFGRFFTISSEQGAEQAGRQHR